MPDNRFGGSSGGASFLKWAIIVIAVLGVAYLAFFFLIGKAVVGTVTG